MSYAREVAISGGEGIGPEVMGDATRALERLVAMSGSRSRRARRSRAARRGGAPPRGDGGGHSRPDRDRSSAFRPFRAAHVADATGSAYSPSKGAIESFTKELAFEAGPYGVRVNAIAPGTVRTPLMQANLASMPEEDRTKLIGMVKTLYALARLGVPEEIAGAAVFLASDQARWITGAILPVDGGLTTN